MKSFDELGLAAPLLAALATEGHSVPTSIQAQAIPEILSGRDVVGVAQTGTGKTAAFVLPVLDRLIRSGARRPDPKRFRVLVLAPTRELARQIEERANAYGRRARLSVACVIGGAPIGRQIKTLAGGVDILVATPGRLDDLMRCGAASLDAVETFVLDEADRMLDLGFIHTIRAIAGRLPPKRQSLFFTATLAPAIASLANTLLTDPVTVAVKSTLRTADRIDQRILLTQSGGKAEMLRTILSNPGVTRALVFARTKRGADRVVRTLAGAGVSAQAIHGNKSQSQRERALGAFRGGRIGVLVATDIAARGIDVPGVSHVVNYDMPDEAESYVHRIGRTARAGAAGVAITFCTSEDGANLRTIERLIGARIPVVTMNGDGTMSEASQDTVADVARRPGKPARNRNAGQKSRPGRSRPRRRRQKAPTGLAATA